MSRLNELVFQNPVRAESKRAFRRFFSLGLQGSVRVAGPLIIGVLYLLTFCGFATLCYSSPNGEGVVPPEVVIHFMTFLALIIPVMTSHNAISGERERRSWDILRVSPVTQAQIVVGKFLSGAAVITAGWISFLPFVLVSAASYSRSRYFVAWSTSTPPLGSSSLTPALWGACVVPLCCALIVLAMTLFFSARCKTSLAAMGISLLMVFAWTVAFPSLLALAIGTSDVMKPMLETFSLSPFLLVNGMVGTFNIDGPEPTPWLNLATACVEATVIGISFLVWTTKTLVYAEQDVKFITKKQHHA